MRGIITIFKRELVGYFSTPVAYVFLVIFLLVAGGFTWKLGGYYDTHNYKFVPTSLNSIMRKLDDLGLTDLRVHRLYPSKYGSIEFVVVLKKGGARGAEEAAALPERWALFTN